ncbi:MAG: hypothetical protein Kow0037_11300 [Calditrichia bacterium]
MAIVCPICTYENKDINFYCTQCGTVISNFDKKLIKIAVIPENSSEMIKEFPNMRITIGRGSDNALFIADSLVSRQHAVIFKKENSFYIKDLNSRNGTFLNGKKISGEEKIKNGSLIKVGKTYLRIQIQN